MSRRLPLAVPLALLFLGLSLGAAATEITTGLALAAALLLGDRRRMLPLLGPLLVFAFAFGLAAPAGGPGAWREVLGRAWPLAPLLIVPALAGEERDARLERLGLWAACGAALWGLGQHLLGAEAGTGPFSHHLTLGYALIPPLAVAARRGRLPELGLLLAGVLCTGGSGPLLSAAVALAGARLLPPAGALAGGVIAALVAIGASVGLGRQDVQQRAVLWASGAWLTLDRPLGVGTGHFRQADGAVQQALQPGFHFPLHAHDSALQLGALVGLGGWVALAWLCWEAWQRTDRAGRALLAALAVGSLTQDVLGDLEVTRAAAAWLAWGMVAGEGERAGSRPPVDWDHPMNASPTALRVFHGLAGLFLIGCVLLGLVSQLSGDPHLSFPLPEISLGLLGGLLLRFAFGTRQSRMGAIVAVMAVVSGLIWLASRYLQLRSA